jgi:hypothetical protein
MLGAVRRLTHILWPGKASVKTPRGVISPVYVKYISQNASRKKEKRKITTPKDKGIFL